MSSTSSAAALGISLLATTAMLTGCSNGKGVEHLAAHVIATYPANPEHFTQGLEVTPKGQLLVGTGWWGESRLALTDVETGKTLKEKELPPEIFGEGITQYNDSIWQLSWQAGKATKYDAHTFEVTGHATYPGEGWGLCALGDDLILSDGTSTLRRLNADTFAEESRFEVTLEGQKVDQLNELECAQDAIYANVWQTTDIMRIDPDSGKVTAVIDASPATGVKNNGDDDPNNVLNGIAHIPDSDDFYITGKRWTDVFRVRFEPVD